MYENVTKSLPFALYAIRIAVIRAALAGVCGNTSG